MTKLLIPQEIRSLYEAGAVFYCSHSGGKDSQAMYLLLREWLRSSPDRLVVVHADLGEVEHAGVQDHIHRTVTHPVNVVQAIWKDGSPKHLLDVVARKAVTRPDAPPWPSSSARWCTSDLKRGPIEKFIRHDLAARGNRLAVNCMGLRAEESAARAKRSTVTPNARLSKAGRTVVDWLPIRDLLTAEVFGVISENWQAPHPAYSRNERLSCVFCIFGSDNDLQHGAELNPDLARKYLDLEESTGRTLFHKRSLGSRLAGIPIVTEE